MGTSISDRPGDRYRSLLLASLLLASAAATASPQAVNDPLGGEIAPELANADLLQSETGDQLQPGEFVWLPAANRASDSEVMIMVSLRDQRAYVYRDGERIAITTVSTGKPGSETPTGVFQILQKKKVHYSNLYDDAPMPFMQRLTWSGVAMHAGRLPGYPASHGCVRLPKQFAQELFAVTKHGQTVVVSDDGSVEALARAGLSEQMALLIGTSSSLRQLVDAVDAVDGEQDYAQSGDSMGARSASHAGSYKR